ncbi:MAG: aldo/keto reductase [Deltaproteobacteria bacterium]|nr:aldo/keto reductase [Deltaproteobacteria bacterium]
MGKGMNRRDFMKSSAAGLGGFVFLSGNEKGGGEKLLAQKVEEKKFVYRMLGKTGIKLPVISMGVMNTDNPNLVRAALDAGYYHLDTAQVYQRGTNEAMIGEILNGRPRDSFMISTKGRLPNDQKTGLYTSEATEEAFSKKIDVSLKNLGLDSIDIYYHHNVWIRESVTYEPILNALSKAKKAGKIRFIGITTHQNEPEIIRAAVKSKFYDVILPAYNFQQKHAAEVKKAIAEAAAAGIGIIAMKTMGGKAGGRYAFDQNDAAIALKWVLDDPNVHTIIAGFTTFDQMNVDLAVMNDMALKRVEREQLRRAGLHSALYCQGCGQCRGQCQKQLPIPDLMRAYMYVYGYRNLSAAQEVLSSLILPTQLCGDCGPCPVKCLNQWNVADRIQNIVRLRDVPPEFIA